MAYTQTQRNGSRTGNDGHQQLGTPVTAPTAGLDVQQHAVAAATLSVRNVTAEELRALVLTDADKLLLVIGFDADVTSANPPHPLPCAYAHVPIATLAVHNRVAPFEVWTANKAVTRGAVQDVEFAMTGEVVFGCVAITQNSDTPLEEVTRTAYRRVFDCIDAAGMPHLCRAWHYLPAINSPEQAMERYRRFSLGRHEAFIDKGRTIEADAPAASALGSPQGASGASLVVYFAATRERGTPLENPRQVSAYRYPEDYGPRSPTFARALLAPSLQGIFYVSGTASIVGHESRHAGDVIAQTNETIVNIRALQQEARAHGASGRAAATHVKVYVRRASDVDIVRGLVEAEFLGDEAVAVEIVYMEADICRSDLLVEIELLTHFVQAQI
jgi:chorismate lyase / 3-hydroxybenzoate synthase